MTRLVKCFENAMLIAFAVGLAEAPGAASSAGRWSDEFGWWQGADGRIRDVAFFDGHIVIAGDFTHIGKVDAPYIALWDGARWRDLAAPFQTSVEALTIHAGTVVASSGTQIAVWDGHTWQEIAPATNGDWHVTALDGYAGDLIAAGNFETFAGADA